MHILPDKNYPLFGSRRNMLICGILSFGFLAFIFFYPKYKRSKANKGLLTKAVVSKFVDLPKKGLSIHYLFNVNDRQYLSTTTCSQIDRQYFEVGDTIYIKYDLDDITNTVVVWDSIPFYPKSN